MKLNKINNCLKKNKSFLITTHVNPDPDAICSSLALALALRTKGKKVTVVLEKKVPSRYSFIPHVKTIKALKDVKRVNYDVAIIVDCGEFNRIGNVTKIIHKDKPIMNIDHHITNDQFGDLNLVLPKASSTAEIVFEIIEKSKGRLNKAIATNIYLGIMTDTGSFRYENTAARTHEIIAQLLKHDVAVASLYSQLYETIPLKDIKSFVSVVNKFDSLCRGQVAVVELKKDTVLKFSKDIDLRDMIFKFLRSVKEIEVLAIFTEVDSKLTRVNFRSQRSFDVAKLAKKFSGGGHKRASGCVVNASVKQARQKVFKEIRKVF